MLAADVRVGLRWLPVDHALSIVLIALSLRHTYDLLYPIATFQKARTCLDAQQSMAKQPIKGCVSNQNRTCGKSVSEKSE